MADDLDFLPLESSSEDEAGQRKKLPRKASGRPVPPDDELPEEKEPLLPQALLDLMPPTPGPKPPAPPAGDAGAQRGEQEAPEQPEKVLADLFPDKFAEEPRVSQRTSEGESVEAVLDELFAASEAAPVPAAPKVRPDADTKRLEPSDSPAPEPAAKEELPSEPAPESDREPVAALSDPPAGDELPDLPTPVPEPGIELEPDTASLERVGDAGALRSDAEAEEMAGEPEPASEPAESQGMFGRLFGRMAAAFGGRPRERAPDPGLEPITQDAPALPLPEDEPAAVSAPAPEPDAAEPPPPALHPDSVSLDLETKTALEPTAQPAAEPQLAPEPEPKLEPVTRSMDTPVAGTLIVPSTGRVPLPDEEWAAAAERPLPPPPPPSPPDPSSVAPEQPVSPVVRDRTRMAEWCRALEARIEALSREKDTLSEENERLKHRVKELVGVVKGIEQAFVIGRLRRGQPLPQAASPPVQAEDPGLVGWSEQDPTKFDDKPLEG